MNSYLLQGESDIQLMRDIIERLPHESTVVDFEETMLLATVRATTRLWQHQGKVVGFAFVDDYNIIRFEIEDEHFSTQLESEIIAWGITCVQQRNTETDRKHSLAASFNSDNTWQIAMLERFGFVRTTFRTLQYSRSLSEPITVHPLPPGFSLRCVAGEHEVEAIVSLHHAAFGTEKMKVEHRLAIMHAPLYERELDLVAVAPNRELAAYCICRVEDTIDSKKVGFTDQIGTHPLYQRRGLGKAMVTAGLQGLKERGVSIAQLSTGSNNIPMQRLAKSLGFTRTSEKLWFSKEVA